MEWNNPVIDAMRARRSVRKFKPELPPQEAIDAVIDAGVWAASGRNEQAAIVVAVTQKELRDKIAEDNRKIGGWAEGFDPFYGAPVVLIVLGNKNWPTSVYDGSLVIGNMMLAAHTLGLASCWIHRAKEEFEQEEYQALLKKLGIEGEWFGVGHCALGFAADDVELKTIERKPNRIFYVK